jgi:23S rRNA (adenine2030-N6)-methyltransferase
MSRRDPLRALAGGRHRWVGWQQARGLNYRHAFHVGNFGDVLKHSVLLAVLRHMHRKDKPMLLLDTHASRGMFELTSPEATRSPEHLFGVAKLMDAVARAGSSDVPQAVREYANCVRSANAGAAALTYYPGSPTLLYMHLRRTDRLVLSELHPLEADALRAHMAEFSARWDAGSDRLGGSGGQDWSGPMGDERREITPNARWRVIQDDGFDTWLSFVPPAERRGLVLCDPPYEKADETRRVLQTLRLAHRRWSSGTILIWFPIKELEALHELQESVRALGIPKILAATLLVRDASLAPQKLNGCICAHTQHAYTHPMHPKRARMLTHDARRTHQRLACQEAVLWAEANASCTHASRCGMLIVNPPFTLDVELGECIPWLARVLEDGHEGQRRGGKLQQAGAGGSSGSVFWLTPDSHGPSS